MRQKFPRFLVLLCLTLLACSAVEVSQDSAAQPPGNLLAGRQPTVAQGISQPARVTDGVVAEPRAYWRTELTSVVASANSSLQYDLGREHNIGFVLLQADGDDEYVLWQSRDGQHFDRLWMAARSGAGMQTRLGSNLNGRARYLRVTARSGDGRYSLGEVAVFAERPQPWPPRLRVVAAREPRKEQRTQLWWWGLGVCAFFLLLRRPVSRGFKLLGLVLAGYGLWVMSGLASIWPLAAPEASLVRALIAAVATVILLRHYFSPIWWRFPRWWTNKALAVLAVAAVGSYYHFGALQFRDHARERQTLVHSWDMRVYFPVAKYFKELRYDGLYLASLAAYLDNGPRSAESIGPVKLRNLRNNEMTTARQVMDQIQAVRSRFRPERWQEFLRDMKYFEDSMGARGYLSSLRDHGGNATPVWILVAHGLFCCLPATESVLTLTALLDPLLLMALGFAVARVFGLRTMLCCAIVFGATDFSRFGSNLVGSTLRFDWMVALGFGACALATRRFALGGALLAYAGLVRGFPALAALALLGPVTWWVVDYWREHRALPGLTRLRRAQGPLLRVLAGGVGCVFLLVLASSAAFSWQGSWGSWMQKIKIHHEKPNVNHVGLRNVVSYESHRIGRRVLRPELEEPWTDWQRYQREAFERRRLIYYGAMALFVWLVFEATRRLTLYQAAMTGMLLVPVFFYPANYYLHYVFLLPLIAAGARGTRSARGPPWPGPSVSGWVRLTLLVMCVAQYFTFEGGVDVVYTKQSYVALAGFGAILLRIYRTQGADPARGKHQADEDQQEEEQEEEKAE